MKVILAYSGGLDTSICIKWLQEHYEAEVITLTLELGQGDRDLEEIEQKAKSMGARKTYSLDCRREFVEHYINPAIRANALYEGRYPVATAIARPLIGRHLARIAEKEKADAVAHGSTGKGNDQVRFELTVRALNPELRIIAPAREWDLTRDTAIEFARKNGIPVPVDSNSPYSTDENLWGRSIEAGPLEDTMHQPSEDVYKWTTPPEKAPDRPEYVKIGFSNGVPGSINGKSIDEVELIQKLNGMGGKHGIGRIDMVEDRLVGIKSREIYECPAAVILLEAHKDLERLTLTREEILFKEIVDSRWAQLAYFGQWYEPLMHDLNSFIAKTQEQVSGVVRLKLYKGSATVVGRESDDSLYDLGLATYDRADRFDHRLAEGFVRLWGLPSEIASRRRKR